MKTLNELKAERLTAIKNRDNEALSEINAKIFAIREQARKERERARAEAIERALTERAEREAGALVC
jgi:DNA integrity scanning protein DisA with diadenylate cyclase activity